MVVLPIRGRAPRLGSRVFIAPSATVVGDVVLGDDVSVWYGVVVRGDVNWVRIGARCNLQDGAVVHVEHGSFPTLLEDEVSVGHGAIVHGCTLRRGSLIGMGAIILNGAEVGEGALVAAGAVIREGLVVPPHTLVAGVPAVIKRTLDDDEMVRVADTAAHYVTYKDSALRGGDGA